MGKALTNVWTYVIIVFIAVFFISGLQAVLYELRFHSNLDMSDSDINFTNRIIGNYSNVDNVDFYQGNRENGIINLDNYTKTKAELENDELDNTGNYTGSPLKDNAIEFFWSKTIVGKIINFVKLVYNLPGYFLILLNVPENGAITIFINIINFLWFIGILAAGYYLLRGSVT